MLERIAKLIPSKKTRDVALMGGGMAALLAGQKVVGLALFGKGALGIEELWRERHPEFSGTFEERWQKALEFYEETHADDTNRLLHVIGIPMIVGGAAGLLLFTPFGPRWIAAAGSFTAGWVLNFIGHGVYEKKAPAFTDDPLSFLAGPIWDLQQLRSGRRRKRRDDAPIATASAARYETGPMTPDVRPGDVPPAPSAEINVAAGGATA
jgi:hypothetical protein